MTINLGPTAVLRIGTVRVVVISIRQQCIDPGHFEEFGVDVQSARTVVVKSRGHFRAGFSVYFAPEQVIECDAPGLTSPNLENFDWQGFKRPILSIGYGYGVDTAGLVVPISRAISANGRRSREVVSCGLPVIQSGRGIYLISVTSLCLRGC